MAIDVNELLAPIPGEHPAGEDAGFSDTFDRIREARRADDPHLAQGDWQTEIKTADWREVQRLAEGVLRETSKDLQAAAWLGEALISRHGLDGARHGFEVLHGLMDRYWDDLFPAMEGGDMEERAGKLAWFASNGAAALGKVMLNDDPQAALTLAGWLDSREVDNLGRQNAEAYQAALDEGRISGEVFDSRMMATPDALVVERMAQAASAREAFSALSTISDAKLGRDAPSLTAIDEALKNITRVYERLATAKGLGVASTTAADAGYETTAYTSGGAVTASAVGALDLSGGSQATKAAALNNLREIAGYFRRTEPHSPVPYLLDRAVAWANLPLAEWLAEVIRDDIALAAIRDRIGLDGNNDTSSD